MQVESETAPFSAVSFSAPHIVRSRITKVDGVLYSCADVHLKNLLNQRPLYEKGRMLVGIIRCTMRFMIAREIKCQMLVQLLIISVATWQ